LKSETRVSLLAALSHLIEADAGGTTATVLGDAYQSIDSAMAARILEGGGVPSRNHKVRLGEFARGYPSVLLSAGSTPADLEQMYNAWLKARYENFSSPPRDLRAFVQTATSVFRAVAADIAQLDQVPVEQLEESMNTELLGTPWATFDEEVARAHDFVQSKLEQRAEAGEGSKLGAKLTNPSNFSRIMLRGDDTATNVAIRESAEVAGAVGKLYMDFLKLIDAIDAARLASGVDRMKVADYAISLRLRYHCEMEAWAQEAGKGLALALEEALEHPNVFSPAPDFLERLEEVRPKKDGHPPE
jgi:hypothetical protein